MAMLTAENYRKVYADVLLYRRDHLDQLLSSPVYVAMCEARLANLTAATLSLDDETVNEVPVLANRHAVLTGSMAQRLESDKGDPMVSDERRAAAARVYTATVEGRRGAGVPASERANHAFRLRNKRAELAADLATMSPEVTVLFDELIDVGDAIDRAMSRRHDPHFDGRQTLSEVVRDAQNGIAQLRRAARALRDVRPDLPAVFEEQLLGYADALVRRRKRVEEAPEEAPVDLLPEAVVEPEEVTPEVTPTSPPSDPVVVINVANGNVETTEA